MKCEYGCGEDAKHQLKNGKWCCKKSQNSCTEIKIKISKSLKGICISEETKRKISDSNKGRTAWNKGKLGIYSKESLKKISDSSKKRYGEKNGFYGKKHTKESKIKMSESRKGKGNSFYGKKHSPETLRKIQETRKKNRELKNM